MEPLRTWSFTRVLLTASGWVAVILSLAFALPPGSTLLRAAAIVRQEGGVAYLELPLSQLRIWAVAVPTLAIAPVIALLIAWWRARGRAAA